MESLRIEHKSYGNNLKVSQDRQVDTAMAARGVRINALIILMVDRANMHQIRTLFPPMNLRVCIGKPLNPGHVISNIKNRKNIKALLSRSHKIKSRAVELVRLWRIRQNR